MLTSIRSHDQFNTIIYEFEDRYRGIHNERRVIFMNEQDIRNAGFKAGDKADLFNYHNGVERVARLFVVIRYNIPERNSPVSKRVIIKIKSIHR